MSNYTISSELRGDDQAEDKDKQVILRLNPQHVTGEELVFSVKGNSLSEFNEEEAKQKDEEARAKRAKEAGDDEHPDTRKARESRKASHGEGDADPNPVVTHGKKH